MIFSKIKCASLGFVSPILLSFVANNAQASLDDELIDDFDLEDVKVYTPSKMLQSLRDAPGAVSIITKEDIDFYGIRSVKEAMRRVPGMVVSERGSDAVVAYHGLNTVLSRRVNVQINGVTIFDPAIATVPWNTLPVSMEEIDRIEVSRSPNASTYGSNSFAAVVNIVTESPVTANSYIGLELTEDDTGAAFFRKNVKTENSATNISLSHQRNDGFDITSASPGQGFNGKYETNRVNLESIYNIDAEQSIEFQGYVSQSFRGSGIPSNPSIFPGNDQDNLEMVIRDINANIKYNKEFENHNLSVSFNVLDGKTKQENEACFPPLIVLPEFAALWEQNRTYAETLATGVVPTGGSVADNIALNNVISAVIRARALPNTFVCAGGFNQNYREQRQKIEIQDVYRINDALRISSTLGFSKETASSQAYFNGRDPESETISLAVNAEYIPTEKLTFNIGGFFEDNDNTSSSQFTPRAAVNYHVNPYQTARFAVTRSVRSPDLFEQQAQWRYRIPVTRSNIPNNIVTTLHAVGEAIGPGDLQDEKITSYELGYLLTSRDRKYTFDIKLFRNELTDLISTYLRLYEFDTNNDGEVTLTGAEFDGTFRLTDKWGGKLSYAYLDNETDQAVERTTYKRHSGSISSYYRVTDNFTTSLAYVGASNDDNTSSQNEYIANLDYKFDNGASISAYYKYNPRPQDTFVSFPAFPLPGYFTGLRETISNEDKFEAGITMKVSW